MSVGPQPNVSGGLLLPFGSGGLGASAAGASSGRDGVWAASASPPACFPPGGGEGGGGGGAPPGGGGGGVPSPPPGGGEGVTPPPPPGSGAPYSQGVMVARPYPSAISGLNITCAETGVTQASACGGGVTFYHDTPGVKHYSTPGGSGPACDGPPSSGPWTSGSGEADVSEGLVIMVQQ